MSNLKLLLLHLPFLGVLLYWAINSPSVGGDGDTIFHYYLVDQAQRDPQYFFDLWGKPFFTLFAYPFVATLGFTGIKIFNVLCGTAAVFVASLVAKKLKVKFFYLLPFLALLAPAYPFYLQTGLTEPFAALVLISIVWLFLYEKPLPAYILISFLPYCRSEAKIFLLFFLAFTILQQHYKYVPWLLLGSVVYALAGSLVHGSVFWIFDSPYASGASVYGSGPWTHFVDRLFVMLALPSFVLLCLGLARAFYKVFTDGSYRQNEMWLIPGLFLAMFSAHTTVWALGIFASAGLDRVLVIVFPMAWVLMVQGLDLLLFRLKRYPKWAFSLAVLFIAFQVTVTATSRFTEFFYKQGTRLTKEQRFVQQEIAPYLQSIENEKGLHLISDEAYLGIALGKNPKDTLHFSDWFTLQSDLLQRLTDSTLILWDDKVVPVHHGLTLEKMRAKPYLQEVKHWQTPYEGKHYVLFKPVDSITN